MKKTILPLIISVLLMVPVMAQEFERPRSGARIEVEANRIDLTPGQTKQIDVWLIKSVKDTKRKFNEISVNGNESINFDFTQVEVTDEFERFQVTLTSDAPAGMYTLILKGEGKNGYKVRSSILMVNVSESSEVAVN
jgi:heme/copper-type cytochrome/quinol oxidase subunit 2